MIFCRHWLQIGQIHGCNLIEQQLSAQSAGEQIQCATIVETSRLSGVSTSDDAKVIHEESAPAISIDKFIRPVEIRAFPSCASGIGKRRTRGRCMVATDTPEKNELEAKQCKKTRTQTKGKLAKKKMIVEEPGKLDNASSGSNKQTDKAKQKKRRSNTNSSKR